jgi:hypothetical protein
MTRVASRVPVIVVKKRWLEEYEAGRKTIEYRRYGRSFTERTFYPGRSVRISCSYNPNVGLVLDARVVAFQRALMRDVPDMPSGVYDDLSPTSELALIHLQIIDRHGLPG